MLIRIRGWNIRVEYIAGLVSGAVSEPVFRVEKNHLQKPNDPPPATDEIRE